MKTKPQHFLVQMVALAALSLSTSSSFASTAQKPPVFNKEATTGDSGILLSEKGAEDLLILSDGVNSEAFEPAQIYKTLVLRCLVPYTQGTWKDKTWPLSDGSSERAPVIRDFAKTRGAKVLKNLLNADPKFCANYFEGMFGKARDLEGNTLNEVNGLAEDVYLRIGDLTKGQALETHLPTTPIGICLADLATVEFLNQLYERCAKR